MAKLILCEAVSTVYICLYAHWFCTEITIIFDDSRTKIN